MDLLLLELQLDWTSIADHRFVAPWALIGQQMFLTAEFVDAFMHSAFKMHAAADQWIVHLDVG
jgi:hypothetical protein